MTSCTESDSIIEMDSESKVSMTLYLILVDGDVEDLGFTCVGTGIRGSMDPKYF